MGSKFSKDSGGGVEGSIIPHLTDLPLYEAACKSDPALETFDRNLQQKTYQVINSIATEASSRSVSFDSFRVLTSSQIELNHEIVKMILDCQKESWDKSLFRLVEDYFKTSDLTLKFLTALENCLSRARDKQLVLQFAVQNFEEENRVVTGENRNFSKTLKELEKFNNGGSPFTEDFFSVLISVSAQQLVLLKKLQARKQKVDKKLKRAKTWTRVSNVLFIAAFASVLIFSVVAASISAPPVVIALASALTVPIGSVGKWCNSLWKNYQKELRVQQELLGMMGGNALVTVHDVENIRILVERFNVELESAMQNSEFALAEEDGAVGIVMVEIKGKLEGFMKGIDDLRECTYNCSNVIRMVRTVISQKIIANSSK